MTPEDKELLLKDICARIPYEVVGKCELDASYDTSFDTIFQTHKFDAVVYGFKADSLFVYPLIEDRDEQEFANEEVANGIDILDFKPYLFPMSSMTDEQCHNFYYGFVENEIDYNDFKKYYFDGCLWNKVLITINDCGDIIDWFNKNHFDYRGLIEKGLAIDATELNIYDLF